MILPVAATEGGETSSAQLYAQTGTGTDYLTSLTFEAQKTLTARFYTTNAADSVMITQTGNFTAKEGLTVGEPDANGNRTLSSATADTYTLNYSLDGMTYSMTVTVTEAPVTTDTITVPGTEDLRTLLSDQATFDKFVSDNHYSGSGDLTLVLPAGDLGSVACRVQLEDGVLTLKGAANGTTKMTGLTVNAANVIVDGITFQDTDSTTLVGITVNTTSGCVVSNCSFENKNLSKNKSLYAFQLRQDAAGNAPVLKLFNNTFTGGCNIDLLDSAGKRIGAWQSTTVKKSETIELDLSVSVVNETDSDGTEVLKIRFKEDTNRYGKKGWKFNFNTSCDFETVYAVYDSKKAPDADWKMYQDSSKKNNKVGILTPDQGEYVLINGTYPTMVKGKVVIQEYHARYLREVTVDTKYANATVTLNKKRVPAAVNSGKLTFTLNGKGTYVITELKTTAKTTKTTSRKYSASAANAYPVTAQGFSIAMRDVKDNNVELNCTDAGKRPVILPVESMYDAAQKGLSVTVKTKGAELRLDAAALKSLAQQAKGDTVLLQYESLNHKTLTSVGLASVQSHLAQYPNDSADLAFLVTATSDSETIEDLQNGTITLKIPFIVLPGTEDRANTVYALQGESLSDARETTVEDGYLTTTLLDLTEHMVFQIGEPAETAAEPSTEAAVETTLPETEPAVEAAPPQETEESGLPFWIPVILVLLLAGGAAVWFLIVRKRLKK